MKATKDALQKRLREEGLLARTTEDEKNPKNNRNTFKKRIKGVGMNTLCFKTSTFEGVGADDDAPDADTPFDRESETHTDKVLKFRKGSRGK